MSQFEMCFEIDVPIIEISIQLTIFGGQIYAYRLIDFGAGCYKIQQKRHIKFSIFFQVVMICQIEKQKNINDLN